MEGKFKLRDVIVKKGTTKPVYTIVEIVDRSNSDTENVMSRPCYNCNSLDVQGIQQFEEDEIEHLQ